MKKSILIGGCMALAFSALAVLPTQASTLNTNNEAVIQLLKFLGYKVEVSGDTIVVNTKETGQSEKAPAKATAAPSTTGDYTYVGGYLLKSDVTKKYPEITSIEDSYGNEVILTIDGYERESADSVTIADKQYIEEDDLIDYVNDYTKHMARQNTKATPKTSTVDGIKVKNRDSAPRGYISEADVYTKYPELSSFTVKKNNEAVLSIDGYHEKEDADIVSVNNVIYLDEEDVADYVSEYVYGDN
ncbi:MAG: hypothetical protein ACK5LT_13440 [Lachnospirales bacterium]